MSNRNTEWHSGLGGMRADLALRQAVKRVLALYDAGERSPPAALEELRERLRRWESWTQR
jgi:3-methyladenine DNA glycosylase/8-oxoguanine DNA glycosylase